MQPEVMAAAVCEEIEKTTGWMRPYGSDVIDSLANCGVPEKLLAMTSEEMNIAAARLSRSGTSHDE